MTNPRHDQAIVLARHMMVAAQQLIEMLSVAKSVRTVDGELATQWLRDVHAASDMLGRAVADVSRNAVL